MRLFVAVEVGPDVLEHARRFRDRVGRHYSRVDRVLRWVDPDHIHLTLRFLGEVSDERVHRLTAAFGEPFTLPAFTYLVDAPAWFPNPARPRVLVRELSDGVDALQALRAAADERVGSLIDLPAEDRAFRPHVTLARVKEGGHRELRALPESWARGVVEASPVTNPVDVVTLYRSELTPRGPLYTALARARLGP